MNLNICFTILEAFDFMFLMEIQLQCLLQNDTKKGL